LTETTSKLLSPSERDRVLRAMTELWAERGYEDLEVEQIIERAGLPPEAFHHLFPGKAECGAAAVRAILGEVLAVVSASYSPDRSEWDSGLLGIKAILELMAAHPSFAYISYIGARQMGPPEASEIFKAGVGMLTAMIDRLREHRGGQIPPASASLGAFGGAEAVIRRELMAGRAERLPGLLPNLAYGATVAFLGQEEALRLSRRAQELLQANREGLT
jgi:AcrR family transcriptional regulator